MFNRLCSRVDIFSIEDCNASSLDDEFPLDAEVKPDEVLGAHEDDGLGLICVGFRTLEGVEVAKERFFPFPFPFPFLPSSFFFCTY